jgi:hypothetical protein
MTIKQIVDQSPSSKEVLHHRDFNIKQIQERSLIKSRIEIIDHVYYQRFEKYLDYR